ncbi:hypothetical protein CY35_01G131400 [Sphagnum magellanicum]|nr:hypothetical protein CY35_01G131400 [Sphagnum magellanicum]KAH9575829.1 hypothetical protein CY35_01G131400 [Sphagnum magellanicum]
MDRERNRIVRQQRKGDMKKRAVGYEDPAKPVWVSAPFIAVAATTAFLIAGHLLSRRPGRRPGGGGGDRSQGGERTNNSTVVPGGDNNNNNKVTHRWNQPMSLAELRALRAEAAESRLPPELSRNKKSSSTGGKLTPLGSILLLARKIDKLEEESSSFLHSVGEVAELDSIQVKGKARLLELLTQVQLEVDGIKSDESVRPHRKSQTNRVQALILALEKAGHATTVVKESSHLQSTSVSNLST